MQYNVLSPHPNVVEAWKKAGYVPDDVAVPRTEQVFFQKVGQASATQYGGIKLITHTKEDPQRPIKRSVTRLYRVRQGEGECLYYTEELHGQNFRGKFEDHSRTVGKYDEPVFEFDVDRETGERTATSVHHTDTKYEIPFTTGKFKDPSTGVETTLEELPLSENCKFHVRVPGRTYALPGITLDEFTEKSFSELVEYGKTGKWSEAPAPKKKVKADE